MLAPNTLLQNRYLIVRSIGHGGMGAVYLARDERLAHTVALKETFFTDERLRKAFEREARLLAHLRHPALPKVTDHFDEDGGQFIVMEFISGDDLEMLLAQRGRAFPVEQVLRWGDELLKALDYLHKQDPPILHRDIKPANLKLTPQNEIILLDFGLAKGTAGQSPSVMTSKSIFGFTPNFAPLEQIQGTGTGPRSDLYSLAATLYYLMTGAIPPDALTRITEVANGKPDPLRRADEVNKDVPSAVADILMNTMAHNRDHRPSSAVEMRRLIHKISPPIPSVLAFGENGDATGDSLAEKKTLLPSTLIEADPTQETPPTSDTATPRSQVATRSDRSPSQLETAPAQAPIPETSVGRKGLRLPWAIAGFVALLMIGVTIGIMSNYSGDKAGADKTSSAPAKGVSVDGAPAEPIGQQIVAAPDDSEISTVIDATGTQTKTRTFKRNAHVRSVVVTVRDGKQTARVLSVNGEERALPEDKVASALEASGDLLAHSVGFVTPSEKGKSAIPLQAKGQRPPSAKASTGKAIAGSKPSNGTPITNLALPNQTTRPITEQNKADVQQVNKIEPKKGDSQPRVQTPIPNR